jgi:hypothetical protein
VRERDHSGRHPSASLGPGSLHRQDYTAVLRPIVTPAASPSLGTAVSGAALVRVVAFG